jgi:tripartite-type tricarboxylate transporter receptor subunit TctC
LERCVGVCRRIAKRPFERDSAYLPANPAKRKSLMRRTVALAACLLIAVAGAAPAQEWPTRPITMVIPFAAGGIDASGRLQAQKLSEILGQPVVVDNIGGAGGAIGSQRVAKAAPDGYTLLLGNNGTHAYSQSLRKVPPYDAVNDFTPAGLVTDSPRVLLVRKDLPVNNMQEFVAYVKTNQARMQFGSAGVGSATHLPCVLLNLAMDVNVTHVPYRGAGLVMQDLIGGRIDYFCDTIQTGAVQVKAGTVKGLAVMWPERLPILPDTPTTGEQGVQGVEATAWNAYFFPKGTPDAIVARMNKALSDMLDDPATAKRLVDMGLVITPPARRTPEHLAKFIPEEVERWGKVIRAAGISTD